MRFTFFKNNFSIIYLFLDFIKFKQCFMFAFLVDRYAADLFKNLPSFNRRHFNEPSNVTLKNDIETIRIDTCRAEQIKNFIARMRLIIDLINTLSVFLDNA